MLIAIGSISPVKLQAVKNVCLRVWPKTNFVSLEIKSKVAEQPIGRTETIRGAIFRAKKALRKTKADLGVGLEGGVVKIRGEWYNQAWCAMVDKKGRISLGSGVIMSLPPKVTERILKGEELGPIMDKLYQKKDVKKHEGATGILTQGLVNRTEAYEHLVSFALVKFLNPKDYF